MKVTLKVDTELLPIIVKAIREYTDRAIVDMVDLPKVATPKPVVKTAKRRGRPPGKKNQIFTVAAPEAVAVA